MSWGWMSPMAQCYANNSKSKMALYLHSTTTTLYSTAIAKVLLTRREQGIQYRHGTDCREIGRPCRLAVRALRLRHATVRDRTASNRRADRFADIRVHAVRRRADGVRPAPAVRVRNGSR